MCVCVWKVNTYVTLILYSKKKEPMGEYEMRIGECACAGHETEGTERRSFVGNGKLDMNGNLLGADFLDGRTFWKFRHVREVGPLELCGCG